ncbi:MAG TPA: terminase family protein [Candidatus Anammoximicrobium sp.]|nr:terminase family protein [Candidatus Anammoximicrobium sp.]
MRMEQRVARLERLADRIRIDATGEGPTPCYCPHRPWPRQQAFLDCPALEVLLGGAASGGKSDAILMAALQYVHVPGYAALILRRDYQRLALAGAIMDRSKMWLMNTAATWNEQNKRWTFPSGATLTFGYIDNPDDRFRYASSEFAFIGWDELTEFRLTDDESNPYTFLFSRLRKTVDIDVPLRMRAASNPGGIGHAFVKARFLTDESATAIQRADPRMVFDGPDGRVFIPAAIRDNPAVDPDEYEEKLRHLPPVTRARLMRGDWSVAESVIIPPAWLHRYDIGGQMLVAGERQIDHRQCRRFATIDTAGTSRDRADAAKGRGASWSVCAVWDYAAKADLLFLRHVWRDRVEWLGLVDGVAGTLADWQCRTARIENAHFGPALQAELSRKGIRDVHLVGPVLHGMKDSGQGAKLDRAVAAGLIRRLEAGGLLLPQQALWLAAYEMELTAWQGLPDEPADQIDVSSYAAWECRKTQATWGGVVAGGGLRQAAGVQPWPSSPSRGLIVGAGGLKRSWW